jgi:hypothetical protein
MMSYLQDTDSVEVYDGSAWTAVGGGGSSPLTTKGDLYTFSTVDARLGVGANGTVLTAASGEATGLQWAAPAAGGKVLQVVSGSFLTEVSNSTSTYADTGVTATITPSAATSKILILISVAAEKSAADAQNRIALNLVKNGTQIQEWRSDRGFYTNTAMRFSGNLNWNFLDAPASTSALTYKIQFKNNANTAAVIVQPDNNYSSITLLEIGA